MYGAEAEVEQDREEHVSVYVDDLRHNGWVLRGRVVRSCHLVADTTLELTAFARRIELKPSWLQVGRPGQEPHFDLVASKRRLAVEAGAEELGRDEFVAFMRRKREERR